MSRAEHVPIGSCLLSTSGATRVTSSTIETDMGVYTVVTAEPNGIIVVNDIEVSSFAISHTLGNAFYHLWRMVAMLRPSSLPSLQTAMSTLSSQCVWGTILN
jgi:hypothetical protein